MVAVNGTAAISVAAAADQIPAGGATDAISVRDRKAKRLGIEQHAFFKADRIAEYFCNVEAIHSGSYRGIGKFAGMTFVRRNYQLEVSTENASGDSLVLKTSTKPQVGRPRVAPRLVRDYESGREISLRKAKLTPDQLAEIKRQMEENGRLGEEFVLKFERRELGSAGRADLAAKVRWVSQESVCEGYDILSYDVTGGEKWIEVKATSSDSDVFEMSNNEWEVCRSAGPKYFIYHVVNVRTAPLLKHVLRDPKKWNDDGMITKTGSGWRITINN